MIHARDQRRIASGRALPAQRSRGRFLQAVSASVERLEHRLFLSATVPAFQSPSQISAGVTPTALVTDDFNADGNEDVAIADGGSNSVSILSGNGDGTFGGPAKYAVGSDPTAIATGDLNGDDYDDIVTADAGSGDISVLLTKVDSDGNLIGTFTAARTFHVEPGGQGSMSLVVDDFNNDGNLDVAVGGPGGLHILFGRGDGTFGSPTALSTAGVGGIVSGDFNGDGNEDIAVTNAGAGTVGVLLGNGDGTFGAETSVNVAPGVTGLATGDFDADGVTDLAATVPGQNQIDVLLGNTMSVSVPEPSPGPIPIDPIPIDPGPVQPIGAPISATDIGATGGGVSSGPITVFGGYSYLTGTGTFAAPTVIAISGTPTSITVADVNGDGNDDLVVSNSTSSAATVVPGNGDGSFGASVDIPMGATPSAVVTDDFNYDGGTDLATANTSGSVSIDLQQSADVGVTVTASAPRVTLGSNLTYTETVTNSGPGPATDVTLSNSLPDGATLVSATTTQGTVDTTSNQGEADVSIGSLASGASTTVTIVVKPTGFGTLSNSVWINSDSIDSSYDNNYANVNTPVVGSTGAELAITADPGGYFTQVGQNITDSFTVTNNGPDTATGVSFADSLPGGVTFVSSSTSQGTVIGTSDGQVSANLGDLAAGATANVSITFKPAATGQFSDTATVAAADPSTDPYTADNTATANTYVYGKKGPFPILEPPIGILGGGGAYTLTSKTSGVSKAAGPAGALPTLSISNVNKKDVAKGTTSFTFTVTRSGNLNAASTVRYQTVDGTAKNGVAYQGITGQLSFAKGVAQQTVTVSVNAIKGRSASQNFVVELAGAINATLKQSRATGTIIPAAGKGGGKILHKSKTTTNPAAKGLNIHFEPSGGPSLAGFILDNGLLYGTRAGGLTFGWSSDNTANAITRTGVKDPRYASFNLLGAPAANLWQIALPNGKYSVQIAAGDSTITSGTDSVDVNGVQVLNAKLKKKHPFATGTATATVTNGFLTLTDASSAPVPLDFIKIKLKG